MAEATVGPVVGPISSGSTTAAAERYIASGAQYTFAIGGLPFMKAPSDERPYARETADFKKQQVDQSNTVGDQSLTGYWTRGQQSFHRGSGIKYYEILDGDSITNRFHDSINIDPWTAGEVTLRADHAPINANPYKDAVAHNGAILALDGSNFAKSVTYAGVATAKASSDGGAFSSIATDGTNVYGTNAAKIERLVPAGSFTALWTHHIGGRTWSYVFWAKDRIWAVDNTGEWYTLSTVGGVTAGSDVLWTSGKASARWSLAESEGGVYIAQGNTVFLSTLDTSTVTPTLVTPTSVASVGAQETIANIGAYLGYLAVFSDSGARLGQIQNSGVVLGAIIVDADFTNLSRVGYRKNLIVATGEDVDLKLYEFNVLEQVADLQPAYAPVRILDADTTTAHGALVLTDGRTVSFCADGLALDSATSLATDGFVQTGFHRFGTQEPKDFRTVSVRAEGTSGTVAVEKILRDGTAVSLVTLAPANFYGNEIALNLDGPTDFIGLRFTISGSVTLLGYQLRALPAPTRQRLIQLPLMCFDVEKVGRVDRGHKGWAWDRLSALEEMEQSSEVLLYQDFETGESATVSVERVQYQGRTPPSNNEGFGGFIVLTLRKVT